MKNVLNFSFFNRTSFITHREMDFVVFIVVLFTLYGIIYFFDRFFKSCMHYPYDAFLKNTGLRVEFLRLKWHTTAFNRTILRLGNNSGTCCRLWLLKCFNTGVLVTLCLLPVAIILLFVTIFNGSSSGSRSVSGSGSGSGSGKSSDPGNGSGDTGIHGVYDETNNLLLMDAATSTKIKLEILLPGINLPLDEFAYYIIALLIVTVIHELGHAIAAVMEDVPVTGFGFHLYFCIPLAFTEISAEHLNNLRWLRKLRILCAGIWHNFILTTLSYLLLCSLGIIVAPWYTLNEYVTITEVLKESPLGNHDDKGLRKGNIISHINDCRVIDDNTWMQCLLKALRTRSGYCVSSDFIRLNDESMEISHHGPDGILQCCDDTNKKLCCFEYMDDISNDAPVEIPQHVCLNVRHTLEDSYSYCTKSGSCEKGFCLRPMLHNTTTILRFKRISLNGEPLKDVIYMGHPADVWYTVRISSFVPKQSYMMPEWGDMISLLLKYIIVFSQGVALINSIPCFGFDGHHITSTILHTFLVNRIPEKPKRDVVAIIINGVGTLLFFLAVSKVLWLSLIKHLF